MVFFVQNNTNILDTSAALLLKMIFLAKDYTFEEYRVTRLPQNHCKNWQDGLYGHRRICYTGILNKRFPDSLQDKGLHNFLLS